MVTPDFEDWLERQEIPIEAQVDREAYLSYLEEELGLSGGSLQVALDVYDRTYGLNLDEFGIHPVERTYTVAGMRVSETRYGISGMPGLFGKARMYEIAAGRAREKGYIELAEQLEEWAEYFGE
jgi:hypothetical protein